MSGENNKKPVLEKVEPEEEWGTMVPVDKAVWGLITKTANRNHMETATLVDVAIDAMLGSLATYSYDVSKMDSGERRATVGTEGDVRVSIGEDNFKLLNSIGVYFGVRVCDLVRDAILAQRWNWQRMQPVNARTMSSIRIHMFELEQLGGHRRQQS